MLKSLLYKHSSFFLLLILGVAASGASAQITVLAEHTLNSKSSDFMSTATGKPKVSAIVPAYNSACYIVQAVESILNQTYPDCEIIVVDDGSTDETQSVLQPYCDRIRYIYQDNQGVATARNRGIQEAKGELIAFLDHDDFFLPDKLAAQVACFEAQPQPGIVHSGWRRVDWRGEPLGDVEPWQKAPNLDLEDWIRWKPILLSAMMFRREWLERAGGLDTQFQQVCDLDLALRLTLMGCQSTWLYQITVCYREHDRNESRKTPLQAQESWTVLDNFLALPQIPEPIRQLESHYRYYTLVWSAWRLYHTGCISEMVPYLEKSLSYTPYSLTKTLSDWLKSFMKYTSECGGELDVVSLSNSREWQQLMNYLLKF